MAQSRIPLIAAAAFSLLLATTTAHSQNKAVTGDQGFVPNTGQINRGSDPKLPAARLTAPISDREEIRAALMQPDPGTISTGGELNAIGTSQPATTGTGFTDVEEDGPIASTMQTKPAKFSRRNDLIDRMSIMGMPIKLDARQRQQIFQAIMADKTQPASGAEKLAPADALPFAQVADMHPLPESLRGMPSLSKLDYVKTRDKVFLVTAETAIVVDELDGK